MENESVLIVFINTNFQQVQEFELEQTYQSLNVRLENMSTWISCAMETVTVVQVMMKLLFFVKVSQVYKHM